MSEGERKKKSSRRRLVAFKRRREEKRKRKKAVRWSSGGKSPRGTQSSPRHVNTSGQNWMTLESQTHRHRQRINSSWLMFKVCTV